MIAAEALRPSSGDQAARYLKALIFDGHLRAGDRVPQDQVAQALGISRIPVREALIALEREGWVTIEAHRGAFVNAVDEPEVLDACALFGMVYGYAARQALERSREETALAGELLALARSVETSSDAAEVGRLALLFHATIVEAARSARIRVLLEAMASLIPEDFFGTVAGSIPVQQQGMAAIARAMADGDGDQAATECTRLLARQGELVVGLFRERGLFTG